MRRDLKEKRDVRRCAENIIAVYLNASDLDRAAGRVWYAEESARLADIARRFNRSHESICGAAAAISPGMRWELVPSHLVALIGNPRHMVPTYCKEFVQRALRCLRGEPPLEVLSGPKTCAFYRLLATAGGAEDVVVDGHAWNIARCSVSAIRNEVPSAGRVTPYRYRVAAAAYREAAEVLGEAPHSVQAATWIYWRRMLDTGET
jgi:hypothetical protein